MPFTMMAVLAAGAARAEPQQTLRYSLERGVTCPSSAQLNRALEHRLGPGVAFEGAPLEGTRSLRLSLEGGDLLRIVFSAGPGLPPSHRTLAIHPGECRELADTVALLAEAWLRQLTWSEIVPSEPPPPAPPEPSTPPPRPIRKVAAPPAHEREPAFPLTLRLAGSGLLFVNAGSPGVQYGGLGGAFELEVGLGSRFGAGLEAAWDAPLFAALGLQSGGTYLGSVTVDRANASAYGRLSFHPAGEVGLAVLAGLRATHLQPTAVGPFLQGSRQAPFWYPGFWLGGEVDQHLGGDWSAFLQIRANIGHSYAFRLESTPGGVFIPSFSLQALAGIGWRFL
jgi:hypothetical protein